LHKNLFAYTAPGSNFPAFVSLNQREDRDLVLTVRAGAKLDGLVPGHTVDVSLPSEEVAKLIEGLLALPPVDAVASAKPLVLYFETDADREECIAAFKEVKPNARAVKV
jgi:hypothetical protein